MELKTMQGVILVGLSGGVALEILHWYAVRQKLPPKNWLRLSYWIPTIAMIVLSGLLAWLYFENSGNAIAVFHVGASTPLLIQKMLSKPKGTKIAAAGTIQTFIADVRDFWHW